VIFHRVIVLVSFLSNFISHDDAQLLPYAYILRPFGSGMGLNLFRNPKSLPSNILSSPHHHVNRLTRTRIPLIPSAFPHKSPRQSWSSAPV